MSRPTHYWYSIVKKMIMSKELQDDTSKQAMLIKRAMQDARRETRKLPNGELRLQAVDDILIRQIKTYEGVGLDIHYDARTVQLWINSYVNLVGRKAGY